MSVSTKIAVRKKEVLKHNKGNKCYGRILMFLTRAVKSDMTETMRNSAVLDTLMDCNSARKAQLTTSSGIRTFISKIPAIVKGLKTVMKQ